MYIERNPVRAGLCARAKDYPSPSAQAHVQETSNGELLDLRGWRQEYDGRTWESILEAGSEDDEFRRHSKRPRCAAGPIANPKRSRCLSRGSEEG